MISRLGWINLGAEHYPEVWNLDTRSTHPYTCESNFAKIKSKVSISVLLRLDFHTGPNLSRLSLLPISMAGGARKRPLGPRGRPRQSICTPQFPSCRVRENQPRGVRKGVFTKEWSRHLICYPGLRSSLINGYRLSQNSYTEYFVAFLAKQLAIERAEPGHSRDLRLVLTN